jgi:hypothetical protein
VPYGPDPDPVGPCNAVDTFQVVLEGNLSGVIGDYAVASTPVGTASLDTTWTSSDPGVVDVSVNGLLTAVAENACATITWAIATTDPLQAIVDATCTTGSFAACVDSAGVDTASRGTFMPEGDLDANLPTLPSGPPMPGVGGNFGITIFVSTGAAGVGAYAFQANYDETIINEDAGVDTSGVGGSSVGGALSFPIAVNPSPVDGIRWNGFDAFAGNSGYFDFNTIAMTQVASGAVHLAIWNEELADGSACNIWVTNTCMPYNSFVCPAPPPLGGYPSISATADIMVP